MCKRLSGRPPYVYHLYPFETSTDATELRCRGAWRVDVPSEIRLNESFRVADGWPMLQLCSGNVTAVGTLRANQQRPTIAAVSFDLSFPGTLLYLHCGEAFLGSHNSDGRVAARPSNCYLNSRVTADYGRKQRQNLRFNRLDKYSFCTDERSNQVAYLAGLGGAVLQGAAAPPERDGLVALPRH